GYDLAMTIMEYTYPVQPKSPDLNDDGRVDSKDYSILAQYWSRDESSVDIAPPPFGDDVINYKEFRGRFR
ncbi:MAG: hypothetical protein HQ522_21110, partial [Bacteroidetes bacterium]|nr:hypothetical protein [Bacteroidota bacterium]